MATERKLTFGKMESASGIAGDDRACDIFLDGKRVGELVANYEDVGGAAHIYRVTYYTASFFFADINEVEETCVKTGVWQYDYVAARRRIKAQIRAALNTDTPS